MPTCGAWLNTESRSHTWQHSWRPEISEGSGALGPEVRPWLGASVIRGRSLFHYIFNQRSRCEEARQAAETAIALQPNLGEALLAKGFYYTPASRITTPQSVTLSKHVSSCRIAAGFLNRWLMSRGGGASGTAASSYFNEAERLDPRNVNLLTQHALFMLPSVVSRGVAETRSSSQYYAGRRRYPSQKAAIAQAQGDLPRASALLAQIRPAPTIPARWKHKFIRQFWSAALDKSFLD